MPQKIRFPAEKFEQPNGRNGTANRLYPARIKICRVLFRTARVREVCMASTKNGAGPLRPGARRDGPGRLRPWLVCVIAGLFAVFTLTNIWVFLAGRRFPSIKSSSLFSGLLAGADARDHSEVPYYGRSPPVYPSRTSLPRPPKLPDRIHLHA